MIAERFRDRQAGETAGGALAVSRWCKDGEQESTPFVYNGAMSERISEAEFQRHAEKAISELERAFGRLAEERDIDVQIEGDVLSVTFEEGEPGRFIVSPNSSVRQIWVSARVSSLKFDWLAQAEQFVISATGETLRQAMSRLTQEQLGDSGIAL
jgi:CyaY protein